MSLNKSQEVNLNKILIISGPTATGKTSLALKLARKYNGELISSDSRQIYRGMNIVTGKELDIEIKTWMVDIANPNEQFSVADYHSKAWDVIKDIWKRGKLPILCGGTGFYIKALLDGIGTMGIKPDWKLRRELETSSLEHLQQRLQQVDVKRWERMNESDRRNPRRLVRGIEIVQKKDSGQARMTSFWGGGTTTPESFLWIGLKASFNNLYERIDQRVDKRLQMGAMEETKRLTQQYGCKVPSMTGQGYRELRDYVDDKISIEEAVQGWKFAEHEYARKQMTWFKKDKRIAWFNIDEDDFIFKVEETVKGWYHN